MAVTILEVTTAKELKKFIWFGISLYKDCPFAAPPLMLDDLLNLKKGKNPALEFCEVVYYLAYKDGHLAGRIAGIINPVANATWGHTTARFGWVDFIDDVEVVDALFNAVEDWAGTKGMNKLEGPMGFTDFDKEGALIEGFDQLATLATIYNYPYYIQHYERKGFIKAADWHEYRIKVPEVFPERYMRIAGVVEAKYKLKTVNARSKKDLISKYGNKIFDLLNESYRNLYGYTKLNDDQIAFYVKLYFSFFRIDTVVVVVNEKDEVVALGIGMPSFTKALQRAKGRLLPFGWWHMLKSLYVNDTIDLYLMAVRPDYQGKGVNSMVFARMMPVAAKNGYKFSESNPELESNTRMSSHWDSFEFQQHKKRRVFIKEIS
jgi:GNAT superfamily N-acetyltransferase